MFTENDNVIITRLRRSNVTDHPSYFISFVLLKIYRIKLKKIHYILSCHKGKKNIPYLTILVTLRRKNMVAIFYLSK